MSEMENLVAPRVAAAVWGLAWNRWCTARRFQKKDRCMLGCGRGEDSAEHYMGCSIARKVGWAVLKLPENGDYEERKKSMLGAAGRSKEKKTCWHYLSAPSS